jgi:hypothetical protein
MYKANADAPKRQSLKVKGGSAIGRAIEIFVNATE